MVQRSTEEYPGILRSTEENQTVLRSTEGYYFCSKGSGCLVTVQLLHFCTSIELSGICRLLKYFSYISCLFDIFFILIRNLNLF